MAENVCGTNNVVEQRSSKNQPTAADRLSRELNRWLVFLKTTAGRDKVYRFVQYFCRLLAFNLAAASATSLAERLTKLSLAVGLGRKRKFNFFVEI